MNGHHIVPSRNEPEETRLYNFNISPGIQGFSDIKRVASSNQEAISINSILA